MINILQIFIDLFCAPKCVGCGKQLDDSSLSMCDDCAILWLGAKSEICPSCVKSCDACGCLPPLLSGNAAPSAFPQWCAFYDTANRESVSSKMVYRLKTRSDRRLVRFIAKEMSAKMVTRLRKSNIAASDVVITFAPRSRESIEKYGFDHAKMLAKEIAKITNTEFAPLIKRVSGNVQKSLSYDERIENAAQSYKLNAKAAAKLTKKHAILIDDVITTGSTIAACQSLLPIPSTPVSFLKTKPKKF
jgi:Predicted amidophosphoribosyltransferases